MARHICCIVLLSIIGITLATPGEYIPKAYYYLDQFGHPSEVVYLRTRRSSELWPIFYKRGKRSAENFEDLNVVRFSLDGSSGTEVRNKRQTNDFGYKEAHPDKRRFFFSRSGEAVGKGVRVAGVASGPNGAFSSSSSSIDSSGKIDYSVKTGRY